MGARWREHRAGLNALDGEEGRTQQERPRRRGAQLRERQKKTRRPTYGMPQMRKGKRTPQKPPSPPSPPSPLRPPAPRKDCERGSCMRVRRGQQQLQARTRAGVILAKPAPNAPAAHKHSGAHGSCCAKLQPCRTIVHISKRVDTPGRQASQRASPCPRP
eukprot:6184607-Pleurochrysis_carterae.AAC.6